MADGKAADATKEVAVMEEDMLAIWIAPTTHVMVLISEIFIGISVVTIGIPFQGAVKHMLIFNAAVERLVLDVVITAHAGMWPWHRGKYFIK